MTTPAPSDFTSIDIGSPAFALRMANLLKATREEVGLRRPTVARMSRGRFTRRDLSRYEQGTLLLDEATVAELALLYHCDLDAIMPPRLPVKVGDGRVEAGGVHREYTTASESALLESYMALVRQLRHQHRTPIVDLRRDDVEVLCEYMHESRESILHRLASLMNARQRRRTAVVGAIGTGVAVVGLIGTAAAVDEPASGSDVGPTSTTEPVETTAPSTTVLETTTTVEVVTTTTGPPETTVYVRPTTPEPTTTSSSTTTTTMYDVNLTTTTSIVDPGGPPTLPTFPEETTTSTASETSVS